MNETFISYSRRDGELVRQIVDALHTVGIDPWFDLEDIKPATKWKQEIFLAIEACHNFVFVISPDSINSVYCQAELERAVKHNKRLIPILYKNTSNIPLVLQEINWIFFNDLNKGIGDLIVAITSPLGISIGDRQDSRLVIETKGLPPRIVFLYTNHYIIGRNPESDTENINIGSIVIKDKYVSRSHVRIDLDNYQWYIIDCNSRNGCFVNNTKLNNQQSKLLNNGDIITLSQLTTLTYEEIKAREWIVERDENETFAEDR